MWSCWGPASGATSPHDLWTLCIFWFGIYRKERKTCLETEKKPRIIVCKIFQCQVSPCNSFTFEVRYAKASNKSHRSLLLWNMLWSEYHKVWMIPYLCIMQNFIMNYPLCISIECKRSIHTLWDMSQGKSLSLR